MGRFIKRLGNGVTVLRLPRRFTPRNDICSVIASTAKRSIHMILDCRKNWEHRKNHRLGIYWKDQKDISNVVQTNPR